MTATGPGGVSGSVFVLIGSGVDAEESAELPDRYALDAAYPNPFNPSTIIPFSVPRAGRVRLAVIDALGRMVSVLHDADLLPGRYRLSFSDARLPSGVYYVVMNAPGYSRVRAVALVR